jgi:hypothetical protein
MSKTTEIWTHIFEQIKYDLLEDKIITATEIKNAGKNWTGKSNQFEPRLLCKQDSEEDRPEIFKKNNLCIISIKNGDYLLTKNNIYFPLKYQNDTVWPITRISDSLILNIGNSESSLLDNLRYSGIFETDDFLGEPILFGPLLSGRHRCSFHTKIGTKEISIEGSQYETDACYESQNKVLLIECKSKNKMESFNIRQLYYPYKVIFDKVAGKKQIIPLFINKNKDNTIHIWKFQFADANVMTSLEQIDYKVYKFE